MRDVPWQVRIAERSIKKRDKLRLLDKWLAYDPSRTALDIGCAQGILSWYLRKKGGFWASADQDMANLKAAKELLGKGLVRMPEGVLPFRSAAFDVVTCLDYLEHIDNDDECLRECRRVLKDGGEVVVVTPHTGRLFLLNRLRATLGMKLEFYGHKREGYSKKELVAKLEASGFEVVRTRTYSKFASELIELALNLAYIKLTARGPTKQALRDGHIRPSTAEEYDAHSGKLKLYSAVYPLVWLISRLDVFLFFLKGYSIMILARKRI
ncbi:MAG TPA: methyltransferase domain-containing protein [Acidobacteriota bacterium]|nr:methyltransferase domain-containing protein [Acidobacteriota bacterium]